MKTKKPAKPDTRSKQKEEEMLDRAIRAACAAARDAEARGVPTELVIVFDDGTEATAVNPDSA